MFWPLRGVSGAGGMPEHAAGHGVPARRIAVVSVGRSDFSILQPLCDLLNKVPDFEVTLWVGGSHFDRDRGRTIEDIEASGLPVGARIEARTFGHDALAVTRNMAEQMQGFGEAAALAIAENQRPDLVLICGDRFEAVAAGLAMVPFGLPIGHISGGSITEGAMDDMFRHALTKLAALHFCDLPEFALRIQQMGEESSRVFVTGALGLDGIFARPTQPFDALVQAFGLHGLQPGYVLATLHTETHAPERTTSMAQAMVDALEASGRQVVYTYPNVDQGSDEIIRVIENAARRVAGHYVVRNFGRRWFYTGMAHAGMMVGNSSSGLYEAASFDLPVVDIGERQKGRFHGINVVHCADTVQAIAEGMSAAQRMAPSLVGMVNPYGDGKGAQRVVEALRMCNWSQVSRPKPFVDIMPGPEK